MKPCTACSCSGVYVGYAGADASPTVVQCSACKGRGWLMYDGSPFILPAITMGHITVTVDR